MNPVNFPESNRTLTPPAGMANCEPLHVRVENGIVLSVWEITVEELKHLILHRKICVQVHSGETAPPIALWVADAVEGQGN